MRLGDPPLHIYAQRDGEHVTGRVVFPHETYGRSEIRIDYHSRRPDQNRDPDCIGRAALPPRAQYRLELIQRLQQVCNADPTMPKVGAARFVVAEAEALGLPKVSVRSLQTWARRLETDGPQGLIDRYDQPVRKILELTPAEATAAVQICAWWAYRIGNLNEIDNAAIHSVLVHLIRKDYPLADVLATIEIYYTADVDRAKYPFISFARWVRYHFTDWLVRAASTYDFIRGLDAARRAKPTRDRRRDAAYRPTRRAIKAMDAPSVPSSLRPSVPPSLPPSVPSSLPRSSSALHSMGLRKLAGDVVRAAACGIPAVTVKPPEAIAESLCQMDSSYRKMLLAAARGDRGCRAEAFATLPIWWDQLPAEIAHNIEARIRAWSRDHPHGNQRVLTARKLDMLLADIEQNRHGAQCLAIAARIPL